MQRKLVTELILTNEDGNGEKSKAQAVLNPEGTRGNDPKKQLGELHSAAVKEGSCSTVSAINCNYANWTRNPLLGQFTSPHGAITSKKTKTMWESTVAL